MTQISDDIWRNSDIVDNEHVTLKDAFVERARLADKEVCMATGYLYLSGFLEVVDSFHPSSVLRVIMGDETDRETADELEAGRHEQCERVISRDLDRVPNSDERLEAVRGMITSGRLQIKIYKRSRFHAKAYIFSRTNADDDKAIVGSSNLTKPGLHSNTELNVVHKGSLDMRLLKAWFEARWDEAVSFDSYLLRLIDESGKRPGALKGVASARRLIQEAASEVIRTYGSVVPEPPRGTDPLAQFQTEGALMLEASIERFGGAILSDSVGLGKTYIGMRVIQKYMHANPSSRVLVIAPRGAMPNWRALIRDRRFGVDPTRIARRSTTELSNYDTDAALGHAELRRLSRYDLVVVDEAHRFRNKARKNRKNLDQIGTRGKRILLISATTVNNSASDLKSIIEIFTDGNALLNHDKNMDIEAFDRYDRLRREPEPDHGAIELAKRQMASVLQAVMVQRTRMHVEGQVVDGRPLRFSNPTVHTQRSADLGDGFFGAFERLLSLITLPHMYIVSDRKTHVDALYRIMLYKRLESSLAALDMSLRRLMDSQLELLRAIDSPDPNVAIERWWTGSRSGVDGGNLDDHDDELADGAAQRIRDMDKTALRELREGLKVDIAAVEEFVTSHLAKKRIGDGLYADPKADALKAVMAPLSGRKVLVFTQSADTAAWLGRVMEEAGHTRYGVVTGHTDDDTRDDMIGRFSPRSSGRLGLEGTPKELSILVATDTLAEAVNLQDCSNVVNFDLPWNPMVMVQRVGRVDRIGNIAPTHVHNIMPSGSLERFLNLVNRLEGKIKGVMDTVGKEFQILSGGEVVNPKRFEQDIRWHPAYTGRVADAVSTVETRGRVVDDMALPARELLRRHGLEILREAPASPVCAALRSPAGQHIVTGMWRVYDSTTGSPLSNVVASVSTGEPEIADEDSEGWLEAFDFVGHGGATRLAAPSTKSRELLDVLEKWFGGKPLENQRLRYSRPGRILSYVERELISRVQDDNTRYVLNSADFRDILFKVSGIRRSEPLREWIRSCTEEKIQKVSEEVASRLQETPGFVKVRHSGDIAVKLICWCAREPS